jgi:hypothetical protein
LREYHASKRVPLSPLINGNNSLLRDKTFTYTFGALFLVYIHNSEIQSIMFNYAEVNVETSSTMSQKLREIHASKRFAHSPLLIGNNLSYVNFLLL